MTEGTNAMATSNMKVVPADPDFITYLLDPKEEYNCYFMVGKKSLQNIERIGVVKKMLLAHSPVLRAELHESKIAEKGDVIVPDLFPDTFKNLLRYVYGYDNTVSLSFDEADNLLYAAEKYMITKLKNKLVTQLMPLLNHSNICSLMNNPAVYTVLQLNSEITKILQLETHKVLASPQFLDLCPDGFLKILEQETANVSEIGLWRAAIKWAKYRTKSNDGQTLRNELSGPLKHIRVCALTTTDFCSEVIPSEVLSYDEVKMVCRSHNNKKVLSQLSTICNIVDKRLSPFIKSELFEEVLVSSAYNTSIQTEIIVTPTNVIVELSSLDIGIRGHSLYQTSVSVTITKDSDVLSVGTFSHEVNSAVTTVSHTPVTVNGKNVQLLPNCSYKIRVQFSSMSVYAFYHTQNRSKVVGKHFSVNFFTSANGYYMSHILKISYRTISRKGKY